MKKRSALAAVLSVVFALFAAPSVNAMDVDWAGQFRFENHWVNDYGMGGVVSRDLEAADGYYIPYAGKKKAEFQTLHMRLTPKLIVNDNVAIKSEWWFGNPSSSFFGSSGLGTSAQGSAGNYYNSNSSGGSNVTAQRFWAEIFSDFGTVTVGRAPFHWGLGLVHHSGEGLWDRFETTGDTLRLSAKFGNFTLSPATTKYVTSEVVGGTWNAGASAPGGEHLAEFSVALKYQNVDEDLEGGVNFVRRRAGAQGSTKWINDQTGSMNFSIWDLYAKKKLGKLDFGVEAPIYSGNVLGTPYKAFALAGELNYRANEAWTFSMKGGKVPGQPATASTGASPATSKWNMIYFNPNYKLGLIMWNYQLRHFAGINRAAAPQLSTNSEANIFDNPMTNANYINLGTELRADKWRFGLQFVTASADETAQEGQAFFNQWYRSYSDTAAVKSQGKSYGKEIDLSVAMDWDEFTMIGLDWGWFFPGDFYQFTDTAQDSPADSVMAIVARVGIKF